MSTDEIKKTCKNCMDYHEDARTHAIFCSNFNTFMDPDDMEICGNFCDNEDASVITSEHPKTPEGMTCRNCRRGHTEEKTQDVFCTLFGAFTIRPCEHFLSVFEEIEDPPVTKDSDTPAHPTANGMTCRDCAMCEELEPDAWYCAQYGSLMDEDNMQPCMHFIFDSELKKEMFSDGSLTDKT